MGKSGGVGFVGGPEKRRAGHAMTINKSTQGRLFL